MKSFRPTPWPAGLRRRACAARALLTAACLVPWLWPGAAHAQQQDACNFSFGGEGAGPFDYRNQRGELGVVERRHFTPKVETLQSGEAASKPGPDIGYTLRKFPNHHRALVSMSKLGQQLKTDDVADMRYSITCYFERAIRFRPDDTVARLIFAQYLGATGRTQEASSQLDFTATFAKDKPLTHYNIGLVALELKDYERALKHAHLAYGLGITTPQLREALSKAGKWTEPAAAPAPEAASPASAASAGAGAARP